MIDINVWLDVFCRSLQETFNGRIEFAGLQGSYGRGEATESSDIDIVVILDEISAEDIYKYDGMLDSLSHREKICGFISGKNEILNWEPADLFQFYFDTQPILGSLDILLDIVNADAACRAIRIGACNIYHACVHNMLHEKNSCMLKSLYKSASYIAQAVYYCQTGKYIKSQKELSGIAGTAEKDIVAINLRLKSGEPVIFREMSEILFEWTKGLLNGKY